MPLKVRLVRAVGVAAFGACVGLAVWALSQNLVLAGVFTIAAAVAAARLPAH